MPELPEDAATPDLNDVIANAEFYDEETSFWKDCFESAKKHAEVKLPMMIDEMKKELKLNLKIMEMCEKEMNDAKERFKTKKAD